MTGALVWCPWCQSYFVHPVQPGPRPKACVQHRPLMQREMQREYDRKRSRRRRHEAPPPRERALSRGHGWVIDADGGRYAVPPVGGEAVAQVPGASYRDEPRRVRVVSRPRGGLVSVLVEGESRPRPLAVERFPELVE